MEPSSSSPNNQSEAHASSPARGEDVEATDAAFVANLTLHQGALYSYLNSLLPGDSEVTDILQRANLVLWQKRSEFEPESNFRAWALAVAYWEARAWMTERKRKGWLIFDQDLAQSIMERYVSETPGHGRDSRAVLKALNFCLAKLSERDRLVIFQYYQQGKSLAQSSVAIGRSPGALKVALHRIRGALRKCLEYSLAKGAATE